jgi:hypothetical protein
LKRVKLYPCRRDDGTRRSQLTPGKKKSAGPLSAQALSRVIKAATGAFLTLGTTRAETLVEAINTAAAIDDFLLACIEGVTL